MNIQLAEVKSNADILQMGSFYVTNQFHESPLKVYYVSPYLNGTDSGLIAIPEVGARVLICQPQGETGWFYLGTTAAFGLGGSLANPNVIKKDRGALPDSKVYKATGVPQRFVWKTPNGNALILSDEGNPGYINSKVELKTGSGKSIKVIDSPKVDAIIIENEHGDRIKLSSTGNDATAPRSLEIECKGPINIVTRESSLTLQVIDGKELNIINQSTGSKRSGPNDPTPGNINITSEYNDVNVTVKSDTGTIYLESQGDNGHIVLKSKGQIDIEGEKGVNIVSSAANVNVKGTQIHLN